MPEIERPRVSARTEGGGSGCKIREEVRASGRACVRTQAKYIGKHVLVDMGQMLWLTWTTYLRLTTHMG